jgi:hypothetical protein
MKQKHSALKLVSSLIAGFALAGGSAMAQTVIADFATDASALNGGTGGMTGITNAWDGTTGNPPGSLYCYVPFLNQSGWQNAQFAFNQTIDLSQYVTFECDIKVDIANSTLTDTGDYGIVQLIAQNWNAGQQGWTPLATITITNMSGWQHFTASLASYQNTCLQLVVAFISNQYGAAPYAGPCHYWLDNLVLTSKPLPAPTIRSVKAAAPNGLTLLPTGNSQWSRVMVYPGGASASGDYSWHNKTFPVTYSFTFKDFPTVNDYAANLFIIPTTTTQYGWQDTSVDWNCTNGLFLNFTANTDNPATSWNIGLSGKTNNPGANPYNITNYNYSKLPNGTWTLTFHNNTDLTITAPDGSTKDVSLPAAEEAAIANASGNTAAMAYIGVMNRNITNIGIPAVMSHIGLTNGTTDISDSFTTSPLNSNIWNALTGPNDESVQAGDQFLYMTWDTPNDGGYSSVVASSSLKGPWYDVSANNNWFLIQPGPTAYKDTLITRSAVHAALGGAEANGAFFRLLKRAYTQLQVLMPGETNAPNTLTGKVGTPDPATAGSTFLTVTINAVDPTFHIVNNNHTINLTSSDGSIIWGNQNPSLSGGTVQTTVQFYTTGSQTITATDTNVTPNITVTGSPVTVQ